MKRTPLQLARAILKRMKHVASLKLAQFKNAGGAPITSITFWPDRPHPNSVVYRILHLLGVTIRIGMPEWGSAGVGFLWEDATFVRASPVAGLINGECRDISKKQVERIHCEVLGYGLCVDPLTYQGKIAVKSDLNGAHDGEELMAPISTVRSDCVYQAIVDNRPPDGSMELICDLRVPVFFGNPAFVYLKLRPRHDRFSNINSSVKIEADVRRLFSPEELEAIGSFCRAAGLDYGEIDVLRDWDSKKIYIVDINKTPHGPPNGLAREDQQIAIQLYLQCFKDLIRTKVDQESHLHRGKERSDS